MKKNTKPEELLQTALASSYKGTLSRVLVAAGFVSVEIETKAELTIKNFQILRADIYVSTSNVSLDLDDFILFTKQAIEICPIGNALSIKVGLHLS